VEVIAERYYEQVHYLPDSTAVRSTVFPRLVVVEERLRERNPTSYVAFYFPDRLTEENYEQDAGEGLLNSLPKEDFSGVIVYTTLRGFPVAASRHEDGRQLSHAFLGDATDDASLLEEVEKYNRIVENIRIFVGDETRSSALEDLDGGDVPPVIVTAPPIVRLPKLENPVTDPDPIDWEVTDPSKPNIPDDPIGDDTGKESSLKDGKYDKNEHIQTTSELVAEILDEIYNDCMGKTLIDAIGADITIIVDSDSHKNGYDGNEFTIYFGDGNENGQQRPYVLIEELVHAYQHSQVGSESFNSYKLNYEIEAKACWLWYEYRRMGYEDLGRLYDTKVGQFGGTQKMLDLIKIWNKTHDLNEDETLHAYDVVCDRIRTLSKYSDKEKYPESDFGRTFNNFEELMKNCK